MSGQCDQHLTLKLSILIIIIFENFKSDGYSVHHNQPNYANIFDQTLSLCYDGMVIIHLTNVYT